MPKYLQTPPCERYFGNGRNPQTGHLILLHKLEFSRTSSRKLEPFVAQNTYTRAHSDSVRDSWRTRLDQRRAHVLLLGTGGIN
ncbi:MAG: hypothetical protein JWO91_1230 [Acidobacteriaceae bacterium]|jgi:hypothetical protein|nr:hypothetical protein [Acidobacteriaceae bacterium]